MEVEEEEEEAEKVLGGEEEGAVEGVDLGKAVEPTGQTVDVKVPGAFPEGNPPEVASDQMEEALPGAEEGGRGEGQGPGEGEALSEEEEEEVEGQEVDKERPGEEALLRRAAETGYGRREEVGQPIVVEGFAEEIGVPWGERVPGEGLDDGVVFQVVRAEVGPVEVPLGSGSADAGEGEPGEKQEEEEEGYEAR